mmetsp:Transcript_9017/g.16368  ORF Transcript_9017/g.16368 Transcript_9017/m.16368 type:complete len:97 (+) Transcript_9017:73-363(+)
MDQNEHPLSYTTNNDKDKHIQLLNLQSKGRVTVDDQELSYSVVQTPDVMEDGILKILWTIVGKFKDDNNKPVKGPDNPKTLMITSVNMERNWTECT